MQSSNSIYKTASENKLTDPYSQTIMVPWYHGVATSGTNDRSTSAAELCTHKIYKPNWPSPSGAPRPTNKVSKLDGLPGLCTFTGQGTSPTEGVFRARPQINLSQRRTFSGETPHRQWWCIVQLLRQLMRCLGFFLFLSLLFYYTSFFHLSGSARWNPNTCWTARTQEEEYTSKDYFVRMCTSVYKEIKKQTRSIYAAYLNNKNHDVVLVLLVGTFLIP